MTDHKPLSEGEMRRQAWRAALCTHAKMASDISAEMCAFWKKEIAVFDIMFTPPSATPKPLDGEAGNLRQRIEHQIQAFKISGKPYPVDLVRLLADCDAALSLPAQTCEATESEVTEAVLPGTTGAAPLLVTALRELLAKAGLRVVKDGAQPPDQFNAGIEAAVQLLIDYGNLGNDATWAAIRALKRPTP